MRDQKLAEEYEKALAYLPPALREVLQGVPEGEKARIQEIRLRAGRPLSVFEMLAPGVAYPGRLCPPLRLLGPHPPGGDGAGLCHHPQGGPGGALRQRGQGPGRHHLLPGDLLPLPSHFPGDPRGGTGALPPVGPEPGADPGGRPGNGQDHPPPGPGAIPGLRGPGALPEGGVHRRAVRAVRHVPGGPPAGHRPLRGRHLRPAQGGGHRAGGADPLPGIHPLRRDRLPGGGPGDRRRAGLRGKVFGDGPLWLPVGAAGRAHSPGAHGYRGLQRGGPFGFPGPALPDRPAADEGGILWRQKDWDWSWFSAAVF